jgi:RNA polymerase sigma-70 factor (ECF subfamily)
MTVWTDLRDPLRRFIGKRVADSHAADDITQDVMLKVQTRLDALPSDDRLAAWMFQIARNAVVDHYRARADGKLSAGEIDTEVVVAEIEQPDMVQELAACLRPMIHRLEEPYRTALILADLEGLSQQQVAERTGISLSGAKSRVQRARQQLKARLLECCNFEQDARGGIVDYTPTQQARDHCADKCGDPECE